MISIRVDELLRRSGHDGQRIFCTLPGGFSDEANWCYDPKEISPEELAPIEDVLITTMSPTDRVYWDIYKIGNKYVMGRRTWRWGDWFADAPQELADRLKAYFTQYYAPLVGIVTSS